MKSGCRFGLALAAAIVALLPARAEAESYSLTSQLNVDAAAAVDAALAEFAFQRNIQSSITDLYFDATGLLTGQANSLSVAGGDSATLDGDLPFQFQLARVTFAEVAGALGVVSDTDAGIRIATHLQGFDGQSDSLIVGAQVIAAPEPAVLALFGVGLFFVAFHARRKKAQ